MAVGGSDKTIPRLQELYFVVLVLYLTLIMSAGFFTMSQSIFEEDEFRQRNPGKTVPALIVLTMGEVKVLAETLLTQALPVMLLAVGPEWVGMTSIGDFVLKFLLWRPCVEA